MLEETAVYNGTTYHLRVFQFGPPLVEFNAETDECIYGPPHDPPIWGGEFAYERGEDGEWDWIDVPLQLEGATAAETMLALKHEIIVVGEMLERLGYQP